MAQGVGQISYELANITAPRASQWRSFLVDRPSLSTLFRPFISSLLQWRTTLVQQKSESDEIVGEMLLRQHPQLKRRHKMAKRHHKMQRPRPWPCKKVFVHAWQHSRANNNNNNNNSKYQTSDLPIPS
jgi:hypothetical protein